MIKCKDNNLINSGDLFYITEGINEFDFRLIDITDIKNEAVYPSFIKDTIENLPIAIERIVDTDD